MHWQKVRWHISLKNLVYPGSHHIYQLTECIGKPHRIGGDCRITHMFGHCLCSLFMWSTSSMVEDISWRLCSCSPRSWPWEAMANSSSHTGSTLSDEASVKKKNRARAWNEEAKSICKNVLNRHIVKNCPGSLPNNKVQRINIKAGQSTTIQKINNRTRKGVGQQRKNTAWHNRSYTKGNFKKWLRTYKIKDKLYSFRYI